MSNQVKYNKPRRINIVSVTLVLLVLLGGFLAYQYLPLYLQRQEVYRVLEETGSKLAGRGGHYTNDTEAREELRKEMQRNINSLGVYDPKLETWIEIEGKEATLGVVYSAWVEWPLDVIERQESVYQLEHVLVLP